jgi:Prokaryotic E2 family E/Multiubiquitin
MSEQSPSSGNESRPGPSPEILVIEIVELEEHAKKHHGEHAPHAKHYAFRVDKTRVVVDTPEITGRKILAEVGKTPELFKLYQHKRGHQPIQIAPEEVVDLRAPGVERFTTMPKDTTEGLKDSPAVRDFRLPASDEEYLEGLGIDWSCVCDNGSRWLILSTWQLPVGYHVQSSALALQIPDNYADTQIDMVYFKQQLARRDGKAIGGLTLQSIQGISWQRWSRHRTNANPWRVGIDDVASHLALVDEWLRREFGK